MAVGNIAIPNKITNTINTLPKGCEHSEGRRKGIERKKRKNKKTKKNVGGEKE